MTVMAENLNMTKITNFLVVALLLSLIPGCMSSGSLSQAQDALTMQEIYDAHFENLAYDESEFVFLHDREDTSKLSDAIVEQVVETFPTLKNPFLVMYVYPHLDPEDGTPIPGYWTTFPMYEQIEFALAGEVIETGDVD